MCKVSPFLPLPIPPVEQKRQPHLARGVSQRIGRRFRLDEQVADCARGINWYGGHGSATGTAEPMEVQSSCVRDLRRLVSERFEEEQFLGSLKLKPSARFFAVAPLPTRMLAAL